MPVLDRSRETIVLSPRTGKLVSGVDVLVVGGGPAGLGAAIGAAQAGSKVVLAEQYGFLGGNTTAGLVLSWASYFTCPRHKISASKSNHNSIAQVAGEPVIAGVLSQFVKRLIAAGGALAPNPETGYVVTVDPEVFKLVSLEMLDSLGVELLFHAFASGVIVDGGIKGVVFETKSGPVVIQAKVTIDCTGDGDVAAFAGAPFELGREEDGLVQPMTLMFLMDCFSKTNFNRYITKHPGEWSGVQGLKPLVRLAASKGELTIPREDILFFDALRDGQVNVNSTRIPNVLGTDVWDLTLAELKGRKQVAQLTVFLRRYVPGFEKAFIDQTGIKVAVRESRRILGEYKLSAKDVLEAKKFKDVIAHGTYPIDIHNPAGSSTLLKHVKPGDAYDIPLRCLLPLKVENLLVAGRCISGTHEAHASYRIMPICMATGQAAGVCSAIACKNNQTPRSVPVKLVQEELINQGARLMR